MTDRAEIERLLQKTGRTLEGLQTEDQMFNEPKYPEKIDEYFKARRAVQYDWPHTFGMYQSQIIELLVGALRDALAKVPKWISVKERLPEHREIVYMRTSDRCSCEGQFNCVTGFERYIKGSGWQNCDVTHWMPLPEPPEEE